MVLDVIDVGHMSIDELGIKKDKHERMPTRKPTNVVDYGHMGIEECGSLE